MHIQRTLGWQRQGFQKQGFPVPEIISQLLVNFWPFLVNLYPLVVNLKLMLVSFTPICVNIKLIIAKEMPEFLKTLTKFKVGEQTLNLPCFFGEEARENKRKRGRTREREGEREKDIERERENKHICHTHIYIYDFIYVVELRKLVQDLGCCVKIDPRVVLKNGPSYFHWYSPKFIVFLSTNSVNSCQNSVCFFLQNCRDVKMRFSKRKLHFCVEE